jgi:NAD(P)-dependent dehydrogenase (short-subunit alcohol dehydrogenase family)
MPDKPVNQYDMQDPTSQYLRPKFPSQHQKEPGLTSKMQPKPDHGEQSYRGFGRLKGRKAVVTGGDSGIGRAAAIAFAREGADVVIAYLPAEESDAQEVLAHIKDAGQKGTGIPLDLSTEQNCQSLIDTALSAMGGIDILVNNAGKQIAVKNLSDITTEQLDQTFKTNVYAMFWLTKYALPHLPKGASIINTTSIQAYQPSPTLLDYAMTKAAIANFTHGLAKQLAPKGIRVNGVAPGPVWTPLQPTDGQPPEKIPTFGEQVPLGRAGQPAELGPTYVFLASQESSYITGEIIGVTGGQHLP